MNLLKQRTQNQIKEAGQGFVEYAIILIFVGIAVVAVVAVTAPAGYWGCLFTFCGSGTRRPTLPLKLHAAANLYQHADGTDPNAPTPPNNTPVPSNTPIPPSPTNTPIPPSPTNTPIPTDTPTTATLCTYGPHHVPNGGSVRVQMEDFRCGGPGVSFSDTANNGPGSGDYRTDYGTEGPDLEGTSDSGGGYNLGWTQDNEWLEYEIIATTTSAYTFVIRHAATNGNNPQIRITTTQGGLQADTGTIGLVTTGGWQNWQSSTLQVTLFQGTNIVRFNIANGGGNYNYIDIQPFVPTATPTPVTPTATPIPTNTPIPTDTPAPVTLTLYSNANHDGYVRERNQPIKVKTIRFSMVVTA